MKSHKIWQEMICVMDLLMIVYNTDKHSCFSIPRVGFNTGQLCIF